MFKLVNGGEKFPERATRYSCGFDVFANEDVVIGAGETKLIGLGIALDDDFIPEFVDLSTGNEGMEFYRDTYYFSLHIRSSLRAKGLTSLGTGIIDMDFIPKCKIGKAINNGHCEHFKQKVKE